jgi:hypothetical protein
MAETPSDEPSVTVTAKTGWIKEFVIKQGLIAGLCLFFAVDLVRSKNTAAEDHTKALTLVAESMSVLSKTMQAALTLLGDHESNSDQWRKQMIRIQLVTCSNTADDVIKRRDCRDQTPAWMREEALRKMGGSDWLTRDTP